MAYKTKAIKIVFLFTLTIFSFALKAQEGKTVDGIIAVVGDKILLKCPSKYQEGKISADSSASLKANKQI